MRGVDKLQGEVGESVTNKAHNGGRQTMHVGCISPWVIASVFESCEYARIDQSSTAVQTGRPNTTARQRAQLGTRCSSGSVGMDTSRGRRLATVALLCQSRLQYAGPLRSRQCVRCHW